MNSLERSGTVGRRIRRTIAASAAAVGTLVGVMGAAPAHASSGLYQTGVPTATCYGSKMDTQSHQQEIGVSGTTHFAQTWTLQKWNGSQWAGANLSFTTSSATFANDSYSHPFRPTYTLFTSQVGTGYFRWSVRYWFYNAAGAIIYSDAIGGQYCTMR